MWNGLSSGEGLWKEMDWSDLKLCVGWDYTPASSPFLNTAPPLTWNMAVDFVLPLERASAPGLGLSPSNATAERDRETASANTVLPEACDLQEALMLHGLEGPQIPP